MRVLHHCPSLYLLPLIMGITRTVVAWEAEAVFGSWHTLGLPWDEGL